MGGTCETTSTADTTIPTTKPTHKEKLMKRSSSATSTRTASGSTEGAQQKEKLVKQADFERFEQLEEQARQRVLSQQIQQQARAQQGDINISHTFNQLHSWLRRAERETTNRIRQLPNPANS